MTHFSKTNCMQPPRIPSIYEVTQCDEHPPVTQVTNVCASPYYIRTTNLQ